MGKIELKRVQFLERRVQPLVALRAGGLPARILRIGVEQFAADVQQVLEAVRFLKQPIGAEMIQRRQVEETWLTAIRRRVASAIDVRFDKFDRCPGALPGLP